MLKKFALIALVALSVACDSGSVTSPTPTPNTPAPVAQEAPPPSAPQTVAPPASPDHDAKIKGGFYSVTNTTGIPQFYCAAAFGVTPGGSQGAGSNLFEDQGNRNNGDVFSGQAPKTAACQYQQIQVDLTQSKDCRNFDWKNVLAAEVYANPNFIKDADFTTRTEVTYSAWSNVEKECGRRTKTTTEYTKYTCSQKETSKVIKEELEEKECPCVPQYSYTGEFSIDSLSNSGNGYQLLDDSALWQTLNLTAGNNLKPTYPHAVDGSNLCLRWPNVVPTTYVYSFHDSNTNIRNACANEHGTWNSSAKTCTTTVNHGSQWTIDGPGNSFDRSSGSVVVPGTTTYESIGCAKASCPSPQTEIDDDDVTEAWHGSVSFKCTQHNSCEDR